MTCIVGLIEQESVWMGADSAVSSGDTQTAEPQIKLFRKTGFLIGSSGSIREQQLVRYAFTPPPFRNDEEGMAYMVTKFVPELKRTLRTHTVLRKEDEVETWGATLLVGFGTSLYELSCDFCVISPHAGYTSIGSGYEIALGVLYASAGMPPEQRIRLALNAAEKLTHYVQQPFQIEKL